MNYLLRSLPLLKPYRARLLIVVSLVVAGAAVSALLPWPMKYIIDHVLVDKPLPPFFEPLIGLLPDNSVFMLLVLLGVASLLLHTVQRLIQMLQSWMETGIGEQLTYGIGGNILEHMQRLSLLYHSKHSSGDLIRRVTTDSRYLQEMVFGVLLPILTASVTLLTMFFIMLKLDVNMTLIALAAAAPIPWLIRALSPRMTKQTYAHQQSEGQVMSVAEQTLTGLPVVQAFQQEGRQQRKFKQLSERSMKDYLKSVKTQLEFSIGVSSTTAVGTALMLVVGGFSVLKGSLTVGELLVFLSYLASLYGPVETLAYVSSTHAAAVARAQRVDEVMNESPSVVEHSTAELPISDKSDGASIEIKNLHFHYLPEEPVLNGISLSIRAGETVALVGTTGSGKSTLASMVPRFYDPENGEILINETNIKEVGIENLRKHISIVLQDPYLLPVSIADNIAFGKPETDREKIVEVAKAANADEFISKLPQGYDTVLSEDGSDLSGGQRQRISIARALLKDASIIILDEPTSALDVRTEALFFEAMNALVQGRTSLIIAHRLSTIRNADRIVVLEAGKVVESGTHDELIAKEGHYYSMHVAQPSARAA